MENVLSQNEVNALLDAVRTGSVPTDGDDTPRDVRAYDLTSNDRIVRGRMPTLDMVHQRLARLMRQSIFNLFRKTVEVTHSSTELIKYGEFIDAVEMPACLSIFRMPPLRSSSIVSIDAPLMFGLVDHVFGGAGATTEITEREYSTIELRLVRQLVTMILGDIEMAWEPVLPLKPEFVRTEINPKFAGVAAPTDVAIRVEFAVEIEGNTRGTVALMIPYSSIEPIRRLLSSQLQTERGAENHAWRQQIITVIRTLNVEFLALLGTGHVRLGQMLALQVGDTIKLNVDAASALPILIEGVEKAAGWPVMSRGRVGVELNNLVDNVQRPTAGLLTSGDRK